MSLLADTPEPPYWAVIFTSERVSGEGASNGAEYGRIAEQMTNLARTQPGFLGVESVRDHNGGGITVSYWQSPEAIRNWRNHPRHQAVRQRAGEWYRGYRIRICKVERADGV